VILLFIPAQALAGGSLTFRLGVFSPEAQSEFWQTNLETFAFDAGDFNYFTGGIELAVGLTSVVDVALGVEGYSRTVRSTYRDFIYQAPVCQEADLLHMPFI
jgi:hypothetical protein